MANDTILFEAADGVATLTLNRPDKLNAFNDQMGGEVNAALREVARDAKIRCLVLTGAGRAFSAGEDLASHAGESELTLGQALRGRYNPMILALRTMEKPVIAAINGVAAGAGFATALACDLKIMSSEATFVPAFSKVGLVPDSGSTFFWLRYLGMTKALEVAFFGERITADQALELGLVNRVVPPDELQAVVKEMATGLARGPTKGFGLTKRAFNAAATNDLGAQLEYEAHLQEIAGRTADHKEGVQAFFEKRAPKFRGA